MVLLLVCFSVTVYAVIRRALTAEFDSSLTSTVEILSASVELEAGTIDAEFEEQHVREFNDAQQPAYYQVWKSDGEVVCRSPLLGAHDLPRLYGPAGTPVHSTFRDHQDHRRLRAVGLTFVPRIDPEDPNTATPASDRGAVVMVVARDASRLYRQLALLRWLLVGAAGATAALALLVASVVVRRGLKPLESIAAEIATIGQDDLGARLAEGALPDEIAPVRDRLNALLSRLEAAFERERRITTDVAHELRTPLAGIRATIEVALTKQRDNAEYRSVLSECLEIATGMETLVANLLMLARLDAGAATLQMERIALNELVDSIWAEFGNKAASRGITWENNIGDNLVVHSDRVRLRMILSNLLDNAAEYAGSSGRIWTTARRTGNKVEITVANTGCTLTGEQAAQVFERFWRADAARGETGVHCGLGLALVQEMAKALHGSAMAEIQDGTFTVTITLPAE
jgi:signal transduction histidine kinase